MITALLHLLACVFLDSGHCGRWTMDPFGLWCSRVVLKDSCPVELERPGWHEFGGGVPVCSRDCGPEPPTS